MRVASGNIRGAAAWRAALLCVALLPILAGGCGGGRSSPEVGHADVAGARAQIDEFRGIPRFVPPGPGFDARRKLRRQDDLRDSDHERGAVRGRGRAWDEAGRRRGRARSSSCIRIRASRRSGRRASGLRLRSTPTRSRCFAEDPALLGPQIAQAEKARIPVIVLRTTGEGERCEADPAGKTYGTTCVPGPFQRAGRLEADWVIQATERQRGRLGDHVERRYARRLRSWRVSADEFRKRCPTCKLTARGRPDLGLGGKDSLRGPVGARPRPKDRLRDPDLRQHVAVRRAGDPGGAGRRPGEIAAFNGTPFVLKLIQDGDIVAMDVGENPSWLGWAAMDQTFRVMAGEQPVRSEHTPLRVFDDGDVADAGRPPSSTPATGTRTSADTRSCGT